MLKSVSKVNNSCDCDSDGVLQNLLQITDKVVKLLFSTSKGRRTVHTSPGKIMKSSEVTKLEIGLESEALSDIIEYLRRLTINNSCWDRMEAS